MTTITVAFGPGRFAEVDPGEYEMFDSLEAWLAEGERRFGAEKTGWKLRCSMCGNVATAADHAALAPADKVSDWKQRVLGDCLGRSLLDSGRGVHVKDLPRSKAGCSGPPIEGVTHDGLPVVGGYGSHRPCDWTIGGLFGGGQTLVKGPTGFWQFVFSFAPPDLDDGQ